MTDIPSRLFPSFLGLSITDFSKQVRSSSELNLSRKELNFSLFLKVYIFHLPLLGSPFAGSH